MIKIGDTVLYIGEYENCHNIEYLVTKVYQERGYCNIAIKGEFNILSGAYRQIFSVQASELIKQENKPMEPNRAEEIMKDKIFTSTDWETGNVEGRIFEAMKEYSSISLKEAIEEIGKMPELYFAGEALIKKEYVIEILKSKIKEG